MKLFTKLVKKEIFNHTIKLASAAENLQNIHILTLFFIIYSISQNFRIKLKKSFLSILFSIILINKYYIIKYEFAPNT